MLSECHPLSEASTCLADRRNLEGNLSRRHALSASSARSASHLSPSRLSTSLALRENSLTRAKCDVEIRNPFFKLDLWRMKKGIERERWIAVRALRVKYTEEKNRVKRPSFDLLGRFVSF